MGFGLVTGFIEVLQLAATIISSAIAISHSAIHYSMHLVLSVICVFTYPVVMASNGRCSPSSGFPNYPHASATAALW
jgi:hypothetical protein